MNKREPYLDLDYLAKMLNQVLEEYQKLDMKDEDDREKMVNQIIGKVVTFFMIKADKTYR